MFYASKTGFLCLRRIPMFVLVLSAPFNHKRRDYCREDHILHVVSQTVQFLENIY
jgi:hypothetical protein